MEEREVPFIKKLVVVLIHKLKQTGESILGRIWKISRIALISASILIIIASIGAISTHLWLSKNYYSNDKAVAMINANAHSYSRGLCAMYVRAAIDHGGIPTYGFPGNAYEYPEFLENLDFKQIATHKSRNYKPQKGDIMVFNAKKGHRSGHIAMYNGKLWVSDFKQIKGMWVADAYKLDPDWKVFRREDGWGRRKISLDDYKIILEDKETWKKTKERRKSAQNI